MNNTTTNEVSFNQNLNNNMDLKNKNNMNNK